MIKADRDTCQGHQEVCHLFGLESLDMNEGGVREVKFSDQRLVPVNSLKLTKAF